AASSTSPRPCSPSPTRSTCARWTSPSSSRSSPTTSSGRRRRARPGRGGPHENHPTKLLAALASATPPDHSLRSRSGGDPEGPPRGPRMSVLVVGISHKSAPVAILERLALAPEAATKLPPPLVAHAHPDEATI